jgi:chromosome segregation ATPase
LDDLQRGLAAAGHAKIALENELQSSRREIEKLQTRLKEIDAQDTLSADKLVNLQAVNQTLMVDLEKLKNAEAEVAELKGELAETERVLAQGNQRQQEMNEALSRSQMSNAELKAELSTQAASIAELRRKLETIRAGKAAGEESLQKELEATRAEKAALQNSLQITRQETVILEARVKDLEARMASSKSQFDYLRTAHTTLTADFEELKKTREQVADLKREISIKDRIIEQKDQQREEWEQKLVRAQNSEDKLKGDLSKQATLAVDLQQHLASARGAQIELEAQLKENRQETQRLQSKIEKLDALKTSTSDQLTALQSAYTALEAEFNKLKNVKSESGELQIALDAKDKQLMQSEQRERDLEADLSRTKKQEDYLRSEISSQAALIVELRDKLKTARADQVSGEQRLKKNQQETAALQRKLNDLETKQTLNASSPPKYQTRTSSPSAAGSRNVEVGDPNPTDIIDFVIKKKSD